MLLLSDHSCTGLLPVAGLEAGALRTARLYARQLSLLEVRPVTDSSTAATLSGDQQQQSSEHTQQEPDARVYVLLMLGSNLYAFVYHCGFCAVYIFGVAVLLAPSFVPYARMHSRSPLHLRVAHTFSLI